MFSLYFCRAPVVLVVTRPSLGQFSLSWWVYASPLELCCYLDARVVLYWFPCDLRFILYVPPVAEVRGLSLRVFNDAVDDVLLLVLVVCVVEGLFGCVVFLRPG